MKINDIYESTTAGSIATVAAPMTTQKRNGVGKGIYGNEPKDSMFKGAKTKKPYANSKVNESKMKELAMDMRNMDNGNFQKKYKKSKEQLKHVLGDPDAVKEGSLNESAYEEAWELISQPVPEIQQFVKQLGLAQDDTTAKQIAPMIDATPDTQLPAASIPKLKNLANKGNDVQTLKAIQQISGRPDAVQQYAKIMQARDAGEGRQRGYNVSGLINSVKSGNYEAPVLLKLATGTYVIGGRTRLYAALALGIPAKVKIISGSTFAKQGQQGVAEGQDMTNKNQEKAKKAGANLKIDPDTGTPDHFTAAQRRKRGLPEGYYSVRSNSLKQELENNGWERIPGREVPDYAKYGYRKNGVGRFYKVIDEPYHSFDVSFVKPRRVIDKLVPLDTLLQLIRGSSVTDDKKTVQEADLQEDDLIIVPGQGRSRKNGLIKHGESRLDHEVEMARSDLFSAAKNAKQVYELIADVSEEEGLEGWVQEKIIKANDYLNTIREYLEGKQLQNEMTGGVIAGGGVGEGQVNELSSALLSRAATKAAFRQRDTAKALHDLENEPGTYFDPEMRGRPGDAHTARKFWSDKADKFAKAATDKRDLAKEKAKSDAATSQMSPAQKRQFSGK